ncbi:MAG: SRPBCC family protein [Candidatus Thorarchaeota archaeon]|jgi:uncharacterized protein YndB with AHSA1/START domain
MTKEMDVEIKHSTLVRASPEDVYDAIATTEGLDAWFTKGSEVDAKPGGTILFRWKDWGADKVTLETAGPVVEAKRPERFVFKWHGDNKTYFTTVEIEFQKVDEGTIIRLREYGYQDTPSGRYSFMDCSTGWGEALTLLKFYVEHGIVY